MKDFNPNARRIYFVPAREKAAFFALSTEEQHQHMARANWQAYEREITAQAEAQRAAQAEWETKYGHLSHEEYLQKQAAEFRAELERPRDAFEIGLTLTVTNDEEQERAHEFAEALRQEVPGEPCPDTLELTIAYETGLKEATITTGNGEQTVFDVRKMTLSAKVLLYPIQVGKHHGLAIRRGGRAWRLGDTNGNVFAPKMQELQNRLLADRNARFGWETPSELLPEKEPAKVEFAHPLRDGTTTQVPNDPASTFFTLAITRPDIWKTNENECFKWAQNQKGDALAIYRPDDEIPDYWQDFRERVLQTLENRFISMKGELVADVADILFWHWLSNDRPAYAGITLSQILAYRGVKPRPNVIEEHWQAMRDVRAIKLRGNGIESESLFHISAAQPNLFGTAEPPKVDTIYRYHPGYFLSEAIQRDAFFLAYYARSVWQLDYYRDANAKRLARVLRAEWRRNAETYLPTGKPRYRTWRALLNEAGIDYEKGRAISNPTKFINSIEGELEKLYQNEFIRECAPFCYHPDDHASRAHLPRKGALVAWLSLRTHIAPAADITDALTGTATRRLARREQQKALAEGKKRTPKQRRTRK